MTAVARKHPEKLSLKHPYAEYTPGHESARKWYAATSKAHALERQKWLQSSRTIAAKQSRRPRLYGAKKRLYGHERWLAYLDKVC